MDKFTLGMIGLGTMGRNLLLNMADNGFKVTGYDKDPKMLQKLEEDGKAHNLKGYRSLEEFVQHLELPRRIILLVPAGKIVDSVINELEPLLSKGDIVIDSGNSHFNDTGRRAAELSEKGIHFFGMGISGGEEGARFGPCMMPGGDKTAYNKVKPILEAVSAKVNGAPCVAYIGPGAAGHFVKMVHNGIEYAVMQLLAETYDLLKNNIGYNNDQIYSVFEKWDQGRLKSFLVEVTRDIFKVKDEKTGGYLVDLIKDEAKSKGTGKWTSEISMDLQLPIPTVNESVSSRDLSRFKTLRIALSKALPHKKTEIAEKEAFENQLEKALYFAMISSYAQGLHLLEQASKDFNYELNLREISRIWRGGCIIRAKLLDDIDQAYTREANLPHLFLDADIQQQLQDNVPAARAIVISAVQNGIAVPCYASALTYFDALRTDKSPLNLTQAQRDFFGAHTFERIDEEGIFHADWNSNNL